MTVEQYPASLVSNPIVNSNSRLIPQGYYRSKLFINPACTNTLVAAAGPLLSLLERICLSASLPNIDSIHGNIEHEIFAFNSKLSASDYPESLIRIAHYLIAATVDEILGKSYLRVYQESPSFKAFTPLTEGNTSPQERFFEILQYIQERPNQHLDLIELVYFLLIVGFEGRYHLKPDGRQALDNHLEDLYQIIQKHRYNQPLRLLNENSLPKIMKNNYKTAIMTTCAAVLVVTLAFFTSHVFLENKAKNVLFGHTQLALLGLTNG